MALELSTAGVTLKYVAEATAGTRPTSGYTAISSVKSIGDLNPEPSNLDATDLSDLEWKRSIPGLKDIGGTVSFTVNMTEAFLTEWAGVVSAFETASAQSSGKALWFEIAVPGLTKSFFFRGIPVPLGLSEISVDSILEGNAYITPNKIAGWADKSTT